MTDMDSAQPAAAYRVKQNDTLSSILRSIWRVLVERFWVLFGVAALLFAAAAVAIMMLTPKYDAVTTLKVDPLASPIGGVNTNPGAQPDRAIIQSEVNIIQSRDLANLVARQLNLVNDPEFDYDTGAPVPREGTPAYDNRIAGIGQALLDSLWVKLNEDSYIITISMTSLDAEKAARIANSFAEVYVRNNVGTRTGTAARESRYLTERRRELEREMRQADAAVAQYKAGAGIVEGGANGTITDQQIGPLASQLASAQSEAAEARAKVAAARAQIARGNMDAVANVLNSPVVTALRTQRGTLVQNRDDITARYGPRHPETIRVTEQLRSLDQQIADEAKRITDALANDAAAAEARARSLGGSLAQLRSEQARNTRLSVTASTLERNAEAKRTAYAQLAKAEQESEQAARNSLANIRVIESARAPDEPTSPNRKLYLAIAFVLAAIAGLAVIAAMELLKRGIRTARDVEVKLGVPLIGSIPALPKSITKAQLPADYLIDKPISIYAESFRALRSALLDGDKLPHVVTIVSSVPAEGKSSTSLSLGRAMALAGDKVVLLDCDFRRIGIAAQTGYKAETGLFQVLNEGADFNRAIVPDRVEGLDLIGNGSPVFTPVDVFSGDAMRNLLTQLHARYDVILIDTPPLLGVADARNLAKQADAVLMVTAWDRTSSDAVNKALNLLEQDETPLAGLVLNSIDPNSEVMGTSYYSSKYSSYYQA